MFYKENMELKLLRFELEQLDTEVHILNKRKQLYKDSLFWNDLTNLYIEARDYEKVNELLTIQRTFLD